MKEDNNELENLYKKAAQDFPLKTGESDWQYVLDNLEEKEEKKPFFWLTKIGAIVSLLIAISALTVAILQNNTTTLSKNKKQEIAQIVDNNNQNKIDKEQLKAEITNTVYKKIIDSLNVVKQKELLKSVDIKIQKNSEKEHHRILPLITINTPGSTNIKTSKSNRATLQTAQFSSVASIAADNDLTKNQLSIVSNNLTKQKNVTIVQEDSNSIKKTEKNVTINNTNKPKIDSEKKSKFYVGFLTSAEINTVGSKREPGSDEPFDMGFSVIAGLHLSKKISIETGLAIRKKTYYTSSPKFNTEILPLKGNMIGIEAENELIEIPFAVNMNLYTKGKHNVFTSIGASSYLVNKEFYEYEEEVNGTTNKENILFNTTSSNFLATANLSLGYEFNLKNKFNLRFQPYINIPVNGLGKVKVPVTSKGFHIGVIYHL
ncbi:MAG: hypothetical protein NTZ59_01995 [Bacteroidetes bacterium]|nr:hypothetical protein [Bacteroidota bacterium]